ncbi:2666_t:CDS:1 [Funneliformis caledonium]|uniref:2666_t:CDS:1 n=1 Tax=Funneliformis caledonium TaxID=1117310 RepID=A0A9N9AR91_9GLOM|nr:2666_t:CDS:1 [Funneliformis caledonium]
MPPRLRNKKTAVSCENCGDKSHASYDCPIHVIDDKVERRGKQKKLITGNSQDKTSDLDEDDMEISTKRNDSPSNKRDIPSKKRLKKGPAISSTSIESGFVPSSVYQPQQMIAEPEVQQGNITAVSNSSSSTHPQIFKRATIVPFSLDLDAFDQELFDEQELENESDPVDDVGAVEKLYGVIKTKIVGVRYYDGVVNKNESVSITREPRNPYDRNALRVDNTLGVQVGHIPRDAASALAPLIDNGSIRIEGTILGNKGVYTIALLVHVFGIQEREDLTTRILKAKGFNVEPLQPTSQARGKGRKVPEENEAWRELVRQGQSLDKRSTKKILQEVGISIIDLARLPEAPQPDALITPLLSYQRQGLGWMLSNEHPADPTADVATQFWVVRKQKGEEYYYNVATGFSTKSCPNFARGGILADDMGLGKTLQTIALIASNKDGNGFISNPVNSDPTYSKTTLIVVTLSILGNWVDQINMHVKEGSLSYYVYHGPNRDDNPKNLQNYDVVVTTYAILGQSDIKDKRRGLFAVKWLRVILDEGHIIRTKSTKQSIAAYNLNAERRWILTGTPIMNELNDMYSLIKFLRIAPFNEIEWWNRVFNRPIKAGDTEAIERLKVLMKIVCLRRTKDMQFNGRSILSLPPVNSFIHKVKFNIEEKKIYDEVEKEAKILFKKWRESKNSKDNYATILEILMRLRQICNHHKLCAERVREILEAHVNIFDMNDDNIKSLVNTLRVIIENNEDCCICLEPLTTPVITHCKHVFDRDCIEKVIDKDKHACPMCRSPVQKNQLIDPPPERESIDEEIGNLITSDYQPSSKIKDLLEFLKVSNENDPTTKSVVFSQWTSFLNLIEIAFKEANVKFVRLDGSMSRSKREQAINDFTYDPEVKVFLISLKCGCLGLNLTAANQCFLMDPWWNPSIEDQAVDRIYRLGQTRPVSIFRFVIENTIEDRVIELQEKKRVLVSQAFGEQRRQDAAKVREARLEELQILLGGN